MTGTNAQYLNANMDNDASITKLINVPILKPMVDVETFGLSVADLELTAFRFPAGIVGPHTCMPVSHPSLHGIQKANEDLIKAPGVRCPRCAQDGIETFVLPGKHCPRCKQPC